MRNKLIAVPSKKEKLPLSITHPELAKEADGWDPTVVISTGQRKSWKCEKGHSWQNAISNRLKGQGCPFCKGKRALPGFNDLKTLQPDLAKEATFINSY